MIGLFDVNMPMLYGEGAVKAFIRLQEEIMRVNEDQSLFAWITDSKHHHGLLADSPKAFDRTGNTTTYTNVGDLRPSTMTGSCLETQISDALTMVQLADSTSHFLSLIRVATALSLLCIARSLEEATTAGWRYTCSRYKLAPTNMQEWIATNWPP